MDNPYVVLNIHQSVTNDEIEKARKTQLKKQCGDDQNIKNEDGEYLSNIINQAADDLLNPEKRKEIDEKLSNKNVPDIYRSPSKLLNVVLTGINSEVMSSEHKIKLNRSIFDKKVRCNKLFVGVSGNIDCIYLIEDYYYNNEVEKRWYLREYFSKRSVTYGFKCGDCPWDKLEVFNANGLLALAFPAYQVIPNSLMKNGKISENALREIFPIIQKSIKSNATQLTQLFEEEQEKVKVYKK